VEWDDSNTRVWRGSAASIARAVIPTGFRELDDYLPGGGWPIGAIIEVFVDGYGVGELALLMPALMALTRVNPAKTPKWVAWIAPPFVPYAPALRQRGVNVDRLLMIHPSPGDKNCLWAIEQVVRSGASVGVLAWVAAVDEVILRRLQLAAEDAQRQRSPAALRIRLSRETAAIRIHVIKCRGGRPGIVDVPHLDRGASESFVGAYSS
jgi:cell division inhibitor SulA/protein ImuA